jgi:hypothetical protein
MPTPFEMLQSYLQANAADPRIAAALARSGTLVPATASTIPGFGGVTSGGVPVAGGVAIPQAAQIQNQIQNLMNTLRIRPPPPALPPISLGGLSSGLGFAGFPRPASTTPMLLGQGKGGPGGMPRTNAEMPWWPRTNAALPFF